jgi:hypothetical protein
MNFVKFSVQAYLDEKDDKIGLAMVSLCIGIACGCAQDHPLAFCPRRGSGTLNFGANEIAPRSRILSQRNSGLHSNDSNDRAIIYNFGTPAHGKSAVRAAAQ